MERLRNTEDTRPIVIHINASKDTRAVGKDVGTAPDEAVMAFFATPQNRQMSFAVDG